MNFSKFKEKTNRQVLINVHALKIEGFFDHSLKVQLLRWRKNKKIIRLRKNLYILNAEDRKVNPSRVHIAGQMYVPSYVSLEYALSMYGLIPEKVADLTCITTKKTARFKNNFGEFVYRHIKRSCFTGFVEAKDESGLIYYIAVPEKALVDFIYLNLSRFKGDYKSILQESFRFQNLESLKKKKLIEYAGLFKTKKLLAVIFELTTLIR